MKKFRRPVFEGRKGWNSNGFKTFSQENETGFDDDFVTLNQVNEQHPDTKLIHL